jgi:hypothetical protein
METRIYQMIERRGRHAGIEVSLPKLRHTFSHNRQMSRIASSVTG